MTWRRESGRDGLPIWRGRDSIVNVHQVEAWEVMGCGYPLGWGLLIGGFFLLNTGEHGIGATLTSLLGWVCFLCGGATLLCFWLIGRGGGLSGRSFFDEGWSLSEIRTDTFHGLVFKRMESANRPAESWAASLAEIARVEAGATKQWISSRRLGNVIHSVTDVECQTFLFMNDGSRRVICSINGDREAAATLAQSVRAWFEAMKASAPTPPRSYARAEGFDI